MLPFFEFKVPCCGKNVQLFCSAKIYYFPDVTLSGTKSTACR